ncbi:alkyl/aryl-sulfatase [Christensenella intestinihominis]|uniref:alkyl/aryl-sulfatase n=1 Tax=Christensenella intestinihominis TaxID=1851429 RepID=UPI0009F60C97|nr:alkyl sulfatase dimerization domain-containing protein [Christensenella intestinihominis]
MRKKHIILTAVLILALALAACTPQPTEGGAAPSAPAPAETVQAEEENTAAEFDASSKLPTEQTIAAQDGVYALLDFTDEQEKEFAQKGLLAAPDELELKDDTGKVVWSQKAYDFLDAEAPDTANPSLWRNAQLNHLYGLFEVADGVYQVRGYDMTNITFIEGDTGWIVFDPLMSTECSAAAKALVDETLGERPVTGIVMSHPHVDHYGGIKGIITEEQAADIPIIVPEGFHEHAVSENVYAGNAMGRRAGYQYGTILEPGEAGSLSIGIGMGQSKGTVSYITPNDTITKTGETRTVDGVEMEFQMTPGTEAPAEMNTWFPQKNALWLAENCTGTLHNLYTLRGAEVRDGNAWAEYIMEAITRYGDKAEVVFQAHNWPHWGNDFINEYMQNTAAMYKFINDQTLMYLNQGYTSDEISNMIQLPEALEKNWYTRQYYGTVAHNSKAVYQKYMGWYDANPVNLNPLAPSDSAQKYVEYLGDTEEVLRKAKEDFDNGEYQWVAEITNVLVFADPGNEQARYLCADALEQLAYQAESGTWRNAYLSGAKELRDGTTNDPDKKANASADLQRAMTPDMMFDQMGILLDANAAQDLNLKINFNITDEEPYLVTVDSGVLLYQKGAQADDADATLTLPRAAMFAILAKDAEQQKQNITIEGDRDVIGKLTEHMVTYDFFFNIVEP